MGRKLTFVSRVYRAGRGKVYIYVPACVSRLLDPGKRYVVTVEPYTPEQG